MKPLATRAARSLSGQRHSDEPARTPAPQLQRWRVDFPGAGRFVRAGPPTEVGVFAGGSLAGKDFSSSSSSFSSASARDLRGGVFRGSFIRRLRGGLRKRAQPLGVNQAVKRPNHIGRTGRNSEARARRPRGILRRSTVSTPVCNFAFPFLPLLPYNAPCYTDFSCIRRNYFDRRLKLPCSNSARL